MGDWLVDALLVPMAEELAQELGVQIPFGEMGKLAGTGYMLRMLKWVKRFTMKRTLVEPIFINNNLAR